MRIGSSVGMTRGGGLEVVLRQEGQQVAGVLQAGVLVLGGEVGDARLRVVGHRAAERLEVDLLAGHRLDDVGTGDEHVRRLLHHEDEVGDRGGVDGAAGAGAHDQADLRDDARAHDVAHEDVAVGAERDDALLDPRAARVVDPDDRAADLGRQVHDLAHLLGHDLAERAAEDGEVLGEDADAPAVDGAVAGDDRVAPRAVALHAELGVRWRTKVSSSWKDPGSSSFSIRSRAVCLPRSCCFSSASGDEWTAASRSSCRCASRSSKVSGLCWRWVIAPRMLSAPRAPSDAARRRPAAASRRPRRARCPTRAAARRVRPRAGTRRPVARAGRRR